MYLKRNNFLRILPILSGLLLVPGVLAAGEGGAKEESKSMPIEDTVKSLQKNVKEGLKVGGYLQARYEANDTSKEGIDADGKTPSTKNQFSIRRGRFNVRYTGVKYAETYFQIDATGRGVNLIDAEVSLLSPWDAAPGRITFGQTTVPFGADIPVSDADLELPERPTAINRFFPGIRDRGIKLSANIKFVRLALGVFNGNGIQDTSMGFNSYVDKNENGVFDEDSEAYKPVSAINFGNNDRDGHKDFIGRLGFELGPVSFGGSAYVGKFGNIPDLIATTDATTGVTTYAGSNDITYLEKNRFGGDVQLKLEKLALGRTLVRAEYIVGHGLFDKATASDKDASGWYVTLAQNLGKYVGLALRIDQFDPDTAKESNEQLTIEPALLIYPTSNLKLTASYQIINDFLDTTDKENPVDKKNNQLTVQLQGRF